jgi:hypothetical protein
MTFSRYNTIKVDVIMCHACRVNKGYDGTSSNDFVEFPEAVSDHGTDKA